MIARLNEPKELRPEQEPRLGLEHSSEVKHVA